MTTSTTITRTYNDKQLKFKQTCDGNNECKIQSCGADINIEYKECGGDICNEVKCFNDNETCDVYSNIIPEVKEITCEEESNEDESEEESNEDESEEESNEDESEEESNEEKTNNSYMKYIFNRYTFIIILFFVGWFFYSKRKKQNIQKLKNNVVVI